MIYCLICSDLAVSLSTFTEDAKSVIQMVSLTFVNLLFLHVRSAALLFFRPWYSLSPSRTDSPPQSLAVAFFYITQISILSHSFLARCFNRRTCRALFYLSLPLSRPLPFPLSLSFPFSIFMTISSSNHSVFSCVTTSLSLLLSLTPSIPLSISISFSLLCGLPPACIPARKMKIPISWFRKRRWLVFQRPCRSSSTNLLPPYRRRWTLKHGLPDCVAASTT